MGVEPAAQLGARVGERTTQNGGCRIARARTGGDGGERVGDDPAVDQGAPVGQGVKA